MHQMIYRKTFEKASKANNNMKTDCQYVKRKHTYGTNLMDGESNMAWMTQLEHKGQKQEKRKSFNRKVNHFTGAVIFLFIYYGPI